MRWRMATLLCLAGSLLFPAAACAAEPVVPHVYRIEHNASPAGANVRSYYIDLIGEIFHRTEAEFGPAVLERVPGDVPQARLLAFLAQGRLDLLWTTTSRQRETMVTPIRIPLDMGLTGQRALVIRADRKAAFDAITSLEELGRLKACQGAYWPDTTVLRAAGLRVVEFDWIDLAYPALHDGRCDYLPRGISEIDSEVRAVGDPGLIVYDRLLLSYPLPMYLFVAPQRTELARRLTLGLERMVDDGGLRRFLEQHPATSMIFPLGRYRGARVLHLSNPALPEATPLGDPRLWLDVAGPDPHRPRS